MSHVSLPRWAVSLADLGLLLLGFFILLTARRPDVHEVERSVRTAVIQAREVDVLNIEAERLFEDGEARLTSRGHMRLHQIGQEAATSGAGLEIESEGIGQASRRFDGWELAAARAAAAARAVRDGGVSEDKVRIVMPESLSSGGAAGQRLMVRLVH